MARVTVEDCLEHVNNRFDLVIMASRRARQLTNGAEPTLEANNDKLTVLALREIGENSIDLNALMVEEKKPQAKEETDAEVKTDAEAKAIMAEETRVPGVDTEGRIEAKTLMAEEPHVPSVDTEGLIEAKAANDTGMAEVPAESKAPAPKLATEE